MVTDGFLTDTRRSSDDGLYTYCKLEGMDYHYLAAWMHKKNGRKASANSRKKFTTRKLFGF
jgi:hypothetical protein